MDHRVSHPDPKPGCFGCDCQGIGWQGHQSREGKDPLRVTPKDHRGSTQTEHWDGRVDAHIVAPRARHTVTTHEE